MSDYWGVVLAVVLLLANAFFVGAEFAIISARRSQIEPRALAGSRPAKITLRAMEQVSLMLAGAQLGITVASLGLGAVAEPAIAHLLEGPFHAIGVPDALLHPLSFVIALTIVVFLHILVGEMVPKNFALSSPETSALVLGPALYGIVWVLRPIIWTLNKLANLTLRALRVQTKDEVTSAFTREEVAALINESLREGLLDEGQHSLAAGALDFTERSAASVAMPLADIVSVPATITPAELESLTVSTGYSRFPVADAEGDFTGYVHVKDILSLPESAREQMLPASLVRQLALVGPQASLRDAVAAMQFSGSHLAAIADPDTGHTTGLVPLEDAVEELIGEVRDSASPR